MGDDRVPALDGVRGVAILLVLAFHYHVFLPEGRGWSYVHLVAGMMWVGVDLFFVLSGFLISGILLDTRERPRYFRNFYIRRALRIFPLYYTSVLLLQLVRLAWPAARELIGAQSLLPAATYAQNVIMSLPDGLERVPRASYHLWSLAIEEQFYLFWPWFILNLQRRRLAAASLAIMVGCLALRVTLWERGVDPRALYFLTPTRIDAFAAGAFVSAVLRVPTLAAHIRRAAPLVSLAGGLLVLAVFFYYGDNPMDTPGASGLLVTAGFTLLAVTFAGVVAWCAQGGWVARLASAAWLRFFGTYSYALYMFHPLVGLVLWSIVRTHAAAWSSPALVGIAAAILGVTLSVLAARASWVLVESPFLRLKRYFPSGGGSRAALGGVAAPGRSAVAPAGARRDGA